MTLVEKMIEEEEVEETETEDDTADVTAVVINPRQTAHRSPAPVRPQDPKARAHHPF